jgi:uncharacterized protein YhfF
MSDESAQADAARAMWGAFCQEHGEIPPGTSYEAWYFGDSGELAEELAGLVVSGKKTATASLFWEYEVEGEALPQVGGYSVITNYDGKPVCVIQTTQVRILPYDEVEADFAADEGEGDLSLEFWRQAHWRFFSRACAKIGKQPDVRMPVVCERFRLVYPAS